MGVGRGKLTQIILKKIKMIIKNIADLIGDTPLFEINKEIHGLKNIKLYAKLELFNPYGSLKDRVAKNILELDKAQGKVVLESSSGNTAKALAALCGVNNLTFETVTNRVKQKEVRQILQAMGTNIVELPGFSECPDPNDPNDPLQVIEKKIKADPDKYFHTNQYFNELNIEAHKQSGQEIMQDLKKVDYFYGFLGTCGSTRGIGEVLKEKRDTKVIGVVTQEGEYVPGGRTENELYETGFYEPSFYNSIVKGSIQEAIDGMLVLNRKCGIPSGPTGGLSYQAIINHLSQFDFEEEISVVFIVCDRIEPYMSYLEKHRPSLFSNSQEDSTSNSIESQISHEDVMQASEIEFEEIDNKNSMIIDIRSNFSYNMGSLPNAINIPPHLFDEFILQKNALPKNKQIILVCPIGSVSKKYVAYLESQGYDAYSLRGGFIKYKNEL